MRDRGSARELGKGSGGRGGRGIQREGGLQLTYAGNPPISHSAQMYGPGRTITCSPTFCARRTYSTMSKMPVKSNLPGVGS